jgi:hypothetical protein
MNYTRMVKFIVYEVGWYDYAEHYASALIEGYKLYDILDPLERTFTIGNLENQAFPC